MMFEVDALLVSYIILNVFAKNEAFLFTVLC